MTTINKTNLLNAARAVRETTTPDAFTMAAFAHDGETDHPCGTPACVIGHYALRSDLQNVFTLFNHQLAYPTGHALYFSHHYFLDHFGITIDEADELFSTGGGCGGAKTPEQAASYIEQFVLNKELQS